MSEANFFRPGLPSLEQDLAEERVILTDMLSDYYDQSAGRPLVDDRIDLLDPPLEIVYLESLTVYLGGRSHEHFLATHAAFHFAINVAGLLDWQVRDLKGALPMLDEVPDGVKLSDARQVILDMTETYMQSRPRLDGLFAAYSPNIDPTDSFLMEAEAIYALTLRQIEFAGIRGHIQLTED